MTREDLYSLAFRYKKTKLWLRLFDTQVFAVRTEKGETIFICITSIFPSLSIRRMSSTATIIFLTLTRFSTI